MTILAETLGKIIRERGGYLSSHDQWLEEKADELRKIVYREIYEDLVLDEMMSDEIINSWYKEKQQ